MATTILTLALMERPRWGVKAYDIYGAEYLAQRFMSRNDIKSQAYVFAKGKLDVGEGESAKSFFHGAADV